MSQILAEWLNTDINLSHQVSPTSIDQTFRSGYLLGEILATLKIEENFTENFVKSDTIEAAIKNFTSLERLLREKLDIRLNTNFAVDLVNAKPGCAARLLAQIRSATINKLEIKSKQRDLANGNRNSISPIRQSSNTSYPGSLEALPIIPKFVYEDPTKKKFNDNQHHHFSDLLRKRLKRGDSKPHQPTKLYGSVLDQTRILPNHKIPSQSKQQSIAEACEPSYRPSNGKQIPFWDEIPQKRSLTPPVNGEKFVPMNLGSGMGIREKIRTVKETNFKEKKKQSIEQFMGQVNNFEKKIIPKLQPIKPSSPSNAKERAISESNNNAFLDDDDEGFKYIDDVPVNPESIKLFMAVKAPMDAATHTKVLRMQFPNAGLNSLNAEKQIEMIKGKKSEELINRKEREQKRRKLILIEKTKREELEKAAIESIVLDRISRLSKQERRIAEQLNEVRNEKNLMREHRQFRESQHKERRQKDYEEALEKEHDLCKKQKEEYKEQTEMQLAQHREILADKALDRHRKNVCMCQDLINNLISLAFKVSEYNELNDRAELPKKLIRQWKTLFLENKSVDNPLDIEIDQDSIIVNGSNALAAVPNETPEDQLARIFNDYDKEKIESIEILDEEEFREYLIGTGDWNFSPEVTEKIKTVVDPLPLIVDTVFDVTAIPEPVQTNFILPTVTLRLAIVGKPFSGKSSSARELATQYGLHLIDVDELIAQSISEATSSLESLESNLKNSKEILNKKTSTKAKIGAKIQLSMLEGQSPSDSTLVHLVLDTIQKLPEVDRNGQKSNAGWILINFPRNRTQAQMLEKELSGYEDPKPIKLGNLKRSVQKQIPQPTTNLTPPTLGTRRRSLISVVESKPDQKVTQVQSGFDMVLLLDVSNEIAIKRATGRKVDVITNEKYHMEFNPTQTDKPGVHERLIGIVDDGNEIDQVQYKISAFEEQEDLLKDWFSRFNNLQIVDSSKTITETHSQISYSIQRMIGKKEKDKLQEIESNTISPQSPSTDEQAEISILPKEETKSSSPPVVVPTGVLSKSSVDDVKGKPASGKQQRTQSASRRLPSPGGKDKDLMKKIEIPETQIIPLNENPLLTRTTTFDGRKIPTKEVSEILADQWTTIESTYTDTLKFSFRCLRRERECIIRFFHSTKENYKNFLERPDRKQELVELFQKEYNSIEDDLRSDIDAKAELHQRAEDLREKLWELSDSRREEAEAERLQVIEDKWVEDHSIILTNIYLTTIQAEVDRFYCTKQFVNDYFRDAYSMLVTDPPAKPAPRIALLASSASPPIDIGNSPILNGSAERRNQTAMLGLDASRTTLGISVKPRGFGALISGLANNNNSLKKFSPSGRVQERDYESDAVVFQDLQNAIDSIYNGLLIPEETIVLEKEKKEKKKGAIAETTEKPAEPEVELPGVYKHILENEEQMLRYRIDRLHQHAISQLKELRVKGMEAYFLLDEWITLRFHSEMDAIREVLNVIKDAVESETKLVNSLVLEGDKFKIDFSVLTFEPDPESRPESPVEKLSAGQFTVLQILNLARQFKLVAPDNFISLKEFVDGFQKIANLSAGMDLLPESYMTADTAQLQQLCLALDPYETGFINWNKFLMLNSKILPTPSPEYLVYLKNLYTYCESYNNGTISRSDFLKIPLWFEEENTILDLSKFCRSQKLKSAIYTLFSCTLISKMPEKQEKKSNSRPLLSFSFSKNIDFDEGDENSKVKDQQPTTNSEDQLQQSQICVSQMELSEDVNTTSLSNLAQKDTSSPVVETSTQPANATLLQEQMMAFDGKEVNDIPCTSEVENTDTFQNFENSSSLESVVKDEEEKRESKVSFVKSANTYGLGVSPLKEHDEIPEKELLNTLFDVEKFLMICTLDETTRSGLQKAFAVTSDRSDYGLTLNQLFKVCQHWFNLIEETHRPLLDSAPPVIYSQELLEKIFEESELIDGTFIKFEQFARASEAQIIINSPLYQIEDLSLNTSKSSRPNSSQKH